MLDHSSRDLFFYKKNQNCLHDFVSDSSGDILHLLFNDHQTLGKLQVGNICSILKISSKMYLLLAYLISYVRKKYNTIKFNVTDCFLYAAYNQLSAQLSIDVVRLDYIWTFCGIGRHYNINDFIQFCSNITFNLYILYFNNTLNYPNVMNFFRKFLQI